MQSWINQLQKVELDSACAIGFENWIPTIHLISQRQNLASKHLWKIEELSRDPFFLTSDTEHHRRVGISLLSVGCDDRNIDSPGSSSPILRADRVIPEATIQRMRAATTTRPMGKAWKVVNSISTSCFSTSCSMGFQGVRSLRRESFTTPRKGIPKRKSKAKTEITRNAMTNNQVEYTGLVSRLTQVFVARERGKKFSRTWPSSSRGIPIWSWSKWMGNMPARARNSTSTRRRRRRLWHPSKGAAKAWGRPAIVHLSTSIASTTRSRTASPTKPWTHRGAGLQR